MDERIKEHLKHLSRYYLLLVESRQVPLEEFINDPIRLGSAERFLHLAIESCLNVGNRILALYQFQRPVKTPETYADIFTELQHLGVVDAEFAKRLRKMAKFRNRLVHLYWEIDPKTLYRILQEDPEDFKRFRERVVDFLNANPLSDEPK